VNKPINNQCLAREENSLKIIEILQKIAFKAFRKNDQKT